MMEEADKSKNGRDRLITDRNCIISCWALKKVEKWI